MDITSTLASRAHALVRNSDLASNEKSEAPLANAAESFSDVLKQGEVTAQKSLTGDADPHALVEALAQSQLAVETAVAVRDKVVEAYQEILRMPI